MRLINKYILKQLIVSFSLVLLGLTALVWLTQSLRMIDMIVTKGVSVGVFLQMTMLVLPNFLQILSPLALFAVILFVFSRMQSDKELMVMQAIGMSNRQIMKPVLMLALVLTVIGYLFTIQMIPAAHSKLNELRWQVRNDLSHLLLQEGQFNSFNGGVTLYVKERLGDGSVRGVMAYDAKDPKKTTVLFAEEGVIFQEENGFQLVFRKGTRQEYNPQTNDFSILKFDKYTMWFNDKKAGTEARNLNAGEYSLSYLLSVRPDQVSSPVLYRRYKVEVLKRLTKPLYNLTFAFLALFGILAPFYNRRGQVGRINFVVLCALLVQALNLGFENLSAKNLLFSPLLFLNIFVPIILVVFSMKRPHIHSSKIKAMLWMAILVIGCLGVLPLKAQIKIDPQVHFEQDKPVNFEADTFSYDKKNDILTASGDVVVEQNGTVVLTDVFFFDRKKNWVTMPNDVTLKTPDGTVTHTKNLSFSADMNQIIGHAVVMDLYEGSKMTASRLKRKDDGQYLYLKKTDYTPCRTCESQAPLWKLYTRNFKHDVPNKSMVFTHSFLEIKDIPVFYFPYLNVPDFSVKRKTGLLAPSFSHGSEMKQGITLPFFVDLSDNQNLIVKPTFSAQHDPLGEIDYLGRFSKGVFSLKGSATQDKDGAGQGHVLANMRYDVNSDWRLSGQYYRTSSDTYFRRYKLSGINTSQAYLQSYLTAERFGTQNYLNMTGLSFQSLRRGVKSTHLPIIIPVADYSLTSDPLTQNGLYTYSHLNTVMYNTRERFKSDRFSYTQGFVLPVVTDWGANIDMKVSARADGYRVDSGRFRIPGVSQDDTYTTGRFYPLASAKFSYPFARYGKNSTQVLEPILMLVTSPVGGNKYKIPNIDSTDVDFDDTNLFSENRFVGYDRVETGTRANYGIQWSMFNSGNKSMSFLFGQSYAFSGDQLLADVVGSKSRYSDYVGRVQLNYDILSLAYRFRLDEDTWEPQKNEISLVGTKGPLRLGVNYTQLKAMRLADTNFSEREEVLFFGSSSLSRNWRMTGYYRYNLETLEKGPIEYGSVLQYDNDCTAVVFDLSRSFTRDRDYKGDTSFVVKFVLKTLGQM